LSVPLLSEIEQEVVLLVAHGRSHRQIAAELHLSVKTVEWHVARAQRKLRQAATLHDRVERAGQRLHGGTGDSERGSVT
jgi:DNA-binding NarL/FixJ family response regulator